jgi:hypothetical protein
MAARDIEIIVLLVLYPLLHRQPFKQKLSAPPLPFVDGTGIIEPITQGPYPA